MRNFWLFVHITSMMLAFGPTYAFPMISAMARKNPKHAPFASAVGEMISLRMTWPFALLTGLSGVFLIFASDWPFFETTWLTTGVGIYVAALIFSATYQTPNARKMAALGRKMAEAGPPPEGAPAGPPPEVVALGKKLQMGGTILGIATLVIIYLMVFKPGG